MKSMVIILEWFSLLYHFFNLAILCSSCKWLFTQLIGQVLDCSLAKPQAERKDNPPSNVNKVPLLPSYTPLGYGLAHGAYGALPAAVPQVLCIFHAVHLRPRAGEKHTKHLYLISGLCCSK